MVVGFLIELGSDMPIFLATYRKSLIEVIHVIVTGLVMTVVDAIVVTASIGVTLLIRLRAIIPLMRVLIGINFQIKRVKTQIIRTHLNIKNV